MNPAWVRSLNSFTNCADISKKNSLIVVEGEISLHKNDLSIEQRRPFQENGLYF
jgi:hypothetical protein